MNPSGVIRRLRAAERDEVLAHLLRLGPDDRRLRFGGVLSDAGVRAYVDRLDWSRAVVIGYVVGGRVRGLGELKPMTGTRSGAAEAALSVESGFQNQGVGTELLRQLIVLARNRRLTTLTLICVPDNGKVVRLAHKLGAALLFEDGEVDARIRLPWPNHLTLLLEAIDDVCAILQPAPRAASEAQAG